MCFLLGDTHAADLVVTRFRTEIDRHVLDYARPGGHVEKIVARATIEDGALAPSPKNVVPRRAFLRGGEERREVPFLAIGETHSINYSAKINLVPIFMMGRISHVIIDYNPVVGASDRDLQRRFHGAEIRPTQFAENLKTEIPRRDPLAELQDVGLGVVPVVGIGIADEHGPIAGIEDISIAPAQPGGDGDVAHRGHHVFPLRTELQDRTHRNTWIAGNEAFDLLSRQLGTVGKADGLEPGGAGAELVLDNDLVGRSL